MEAKVMYYLTTLLASATAASISGSASLDPTQASFGGQLIFPQLPGINAALGNQNLYNSSALNSASGLFAPFLNLIPGLNSAISNSNSSYATNGNGTLNLPFQNQVLNFPGVSEAINYANRHLMAALNITTDLSTGLRAAVETALKSENPAASCRVIMNTIAKVYGTIAANCPVLIISHRILAEGLRLAADVAKAFGNVAFGRNDNNNVSSFGNLLKVSF